MKTIVKRLDPRTNPSQPTAEEPRLPLRLAMHHVRNLSSHLSHLTCTWRRLSSQCPTQHSRHLSALRLSGVTPITPLHSLIHRLLHTIPFVLPRIHHPYSRLEAFTLLSPLRPGPHPHIGVCDEFPRHARPRSMRREGVVKFTRESVELREAGPRDRREVVVLVVVSDLKR